MSDEDSGNSPPAGDSALIRVPELPERVVNTYSRLWQLETWLRRLVYVELRAAYGDDWESKLPDARRARDADMRLTHMPTPESDMLSFSQFSALRGLIRDEWRLFAPFLPPKDIWEAKLEEVSQVRHRVAHFRRGHEDDLQRVVQLLRDIDQGFWRFCTSFNDAHPVLPQSDDPVVLRFLPLDLIPWGQLEDGKWARVGMADPDESLWVTVEVLCRPWAEWSAPAAAGSEGLLYQVMLHARRRSFDLRQFMDHSRVSHKHFVYVTLGSGSESVEVTIPAVLGAAAVIRHVERLIDAGRYSLRPSISTAHGERIIRDLVAGYPEFVLGPENPLSFLSPDMPCSFFGA